MGHGALCSFDGDGEHEIKVWIKDRDRWYPGVLETWNTRDGMLRGWVTYSAAVNGWHGGWYRMSDIREDVGEDPNGEIMGDDVRT